MADEMSGCAQNLLIKYLKELQQMELKKFKVLLGVHPVEPGYSNIPSAWLKNADYLEIADEMIIHYLEEYSLEIAEDVLCQIPRMDLCQQFRFDSQNYLERSRNPQPTRSNQHKINYVEYVNEKFRSSGECISLTERYTKVNIIKKHRPQVEREHELMSAGRRHLQIMAQRAEHSYSSIEALFDPDEKGHVPRTVVLQGAAGIGKTMTARKIMFDWASGELFKDRFDLLFYVNCREMNQCSVELTISDLLSHSYPGMSLPMRREMEAEPEKLLFIVDEFDKLNSSTDHMRGNIQNTMMQLIHRHFFPTSYILIIIRPTALDKLMTCVVDPRFAEILGFSEDDKKEYFVKYFRNETQGTQVFNIVKENDFLYTMCCVPIVCWIVCTAIQQKMGGNEDLLNAVRTTSVYMSFFSSSLKQQSSDSVQPIHMNLQKLCALAKEGVWEQKILFYEEDLVSRGLDIPAIQSLFLMKEIFKKSAQYKECYSFIHLSFQEFFSAMFYVLRGNEETAEQTENHRQDVISLLEASRDQKHLMLTVRFLFGLLNKETVNQMENRFKWKISPDIKTDLLEWIKGEMKQDFSWINNEQLELFHCLYEIQDDEFIKSGTEHLKYIGIAEESMCVGMNAMDFRALGFSLNNSTGVQRFDISDIEMKSADVKALITGVMKCCSLKMERCSLTASHCADLSSVLSANSSLTELNLRGNKLKDSGVSELCKGLKDPGCKIQKLVMDKCFLTASCCAHLSSVLRTNPHLAELNLSDNTIEDSGVSELCEGLKQEGCKIQKLVLSDCYITDSCCADLSSAVRTNPALKELDLSENTLMDSGVRELRKGLEHPGCNIQKLVMNSCSLTGSCCADLSSVFRTNTALMELDLGFNELEDTGVRELCEGLQDPDCRIQTLLIDHCSLTASCCAALSSVFIRNTSLTELSLKFNTLEDSGVRELCEGLKTSDCKIQKLVLDSCSLTGSCCAHITSVMRTNTSLKELDLSRNTLEDSGVRALCEGLKHPACRIQTLVLGSCSLTASCCADLSSVLCMGASLSELDLRRNELQDVGVITLCEGLEHPGCKIQRLVLERCSLTDSCCADLSSVLRTSVSLTELSLSGNTLWDSGAIALCEGLKHPECRIQKMVVSRTQLTDGCTEALCSALHTNQMLQSLVLAGNYFTEVSAPSFRKCEGRAHLFLP